jgi:hypothetical protein
MHVVWVKQDTRTISHAIFQQERKSREPNYEFYGDFKTGLREMYCEDVSWI